MFNVEDTEQYLRESISTDENQIEHEYVRIAPDIYFWGSKYAETHQNYLLKKLEVSTIRAKVYLVQREKAKEKGRATEAEIAAMVEVDPEVQAANFELIKAEIDRQKSLNVVEAVRSKRDMLQGLGASIRAQINSNIRINK